MDEVVLRKRTMTRSTKKKHVKKVKKLIKKLKDHNINMKKECDAKVAYLHIKLIEKEYYLNSILDFMNCNFRSAWDTAVYRGYKQMCHDFVD